MRAIGIFNGNSNHQQAKREQELYTPVPAATIAEQIEILTEVIGREEKALAYYQKLDDDLRVKIWEGALVNWRAKLAELEAEQVCALDWGGTSEEYKQYAKSANTKGEASRWARGG